MNRDASCERDWFIKNPPPCNKICPFLPFQTQRALPKSQTKVEMAAAASSSSSSSSSTSSSSSGRGSDPCPICLEPVKKDEAYLDRCFHSFCYKCIIRWSGVVINKHSQSLSSIKCPLCKIENFSIVHGFNGEFFQRHYVNQDSTKCYLSSAHEFRLRCYTGNAGITNNIFDVKRYWNCCKYLHKNIWLHSWLRREIQALVQEDDVDIIVQHILGLIQPFLERREREGIKCKPEQKREEFRALLADSARPFILGQTECFVNEVELFLASGLNIEAYDKVCMQFLGMSSSLTREDDEESRDVQDPHQYFIGEDLTKLIKDHRLK